MEINNRQPRAYRGIFIMKRQMNLTLPEWAFLDANLHNGNILEGRDVLLHIRSNTMLEFFNNDSIEIHINESVRSCQFTYASKYGVKENYTVVVHHSFAEYMALDDIIDKAIALYKEWILWMDISIEKENNSKIN